MFGLGKGKDGKRGEREGGKRKVEERMSEGWSFGRYATAVCLSVCSSVACETY